MNFYTTPKIRGLTSTPNRHGGVQSELQMILPHFLSLLIVITGILILEYSFWIRILHSPTHFFFAENILRDGFFRNFWFVCFIMKSHVYHHLHMLYVLLSNVGHIRIVICPYLVIDSFINVISLVLLICVLELICSHSCYCLYQQFNTCSSPRTMSVFRFLIDCLRSFGIEPTISTWFVSTMS